MANNVIQHKRTSTAGRQPNTTVSTNSQYIAAGEFALNMADQILYTSDGTNLITVGANTVNQRITGTLTVNAISANGSLGANNQVLTSNATGGVYWGAGGGFSNGQSISVSNLAITGSLTANGSVGTSGQALVSTGTGVQWGTSSPGYNYSSAFNGAVGNYLAVGTSSTLALGAGDFTIECWIYPTAWNSNTSGIWDYRTNGGSTTNIPAIFLSAAGVPVVTFNIGGAAAITGSTALTLNAWNHLALVRSGTAVTMYLNGVSIGSTTSSATFGIQTFNINNSISGATNYSQAGYFSNFRIVKGTAVYTSAFTVPTSPLSAISGTVLLTCNAITPTSDSSSYVWTITNNGAVTTTATLSPFTSTTVSIPTASVTAVRQQFTGDGSTTTFAVAGGYTPNAISVFVNGVMLRNGTEVTVTNGATVVLGFAPPSGALIDVIGTVPTTYSSITPQSYSTSFSGSSQWLSIAYSATPMSLTGDYTIEAWIYPTAFTNGSSANGLSILSQGGSQNVDVNGVSIQLTSAGTIQNITKNVNGNVSSTKSGVPLNTWSHIAVCRIGSSITIYVNGNAGTTVSLAGTITNASFPLYIGRPSTVDYWGYFQGYISNVRVVNGVGVYTGAFTPPQTPLAAVQSAGPNVAAITGTQTSLLTCNGPTIIDGSTNAFTITNNGSAPVSTAIVPTFTNVTITSYPPPTTIGNIPFTTDGTTWSSTQKIVQGTSVATTSGTAIDFTSIPSWVKRITVTLNGVSVSGISQIQVQIGSGSVTTTGYISAASNAQGSALAVLTSTTGFTTGGANPANLHYTTFSIVNPSGFVYLCSGNGNINSSGTFSVYDSSGTVTLSGIIDRLRLTTVNGTDTFDAGSVNILYE